MDDWLQATADAPHGPASNPPHRPAHPGLLRWPVAGAAASLASCQSAGVLDPQGPIASAQRLLLINSTAIMLVVVVPVILATLALRLVVPRVECPRQPRLGRIL